jgi:Tol biopolymer transport system component
VTALGSDALSLRGNGAGVVFSPDGSLVVYTAQPALLSATVLYRRRLNSLDVERLPGTEGALSPFFSSDSRWIGFFTDKGLMKVPIDGGTPSKICDRGTFSRADWAPNGTIVLGTSQIFAPGALGSVPASGGTPAPLTTLAGKETLHQSPHLLPDGRHVVFTVVTPGRSEIATAPIEGGAHELLNLEGSGAMFVPPGHLLFARGDVLYTVAFDPSRRRTSGTPAQVLDDAGVFAGGVQVWHPLAGVDRAGSVAYLNKGGSTSVLGWMTPASAMTPIALPPADYRSPVLSPDGRLAAVTAGAAPPDIWVVNLERGTRLRLTSTGGSVPVWSPDGSRIAYSSPDTGLMSIAANGGGTPEVILPRQDGKSVFPTSWSPDARSLVITAEDRGAGGSVRNRDIWIVRPGEKPEPALASSADERGGVVSPDGHWLAYASAVSGREEIYLRRFNDAGGTIPVSTDGGTLPKWSRTGDALYFLANGPRLMRASVRGNPPHVGAPVVAMSLPAAMGGIDVAGDGRVLIVMQKNDTAARDALHILLNWGQSLR